MKKKLTPYEIYKNTVKELSAVDYINVLDMDYDMAEFTRKNAEGYYRIQIAIACENSIFGAVVIEYYDNTEADWFDVISYFIDTHTVPEQLVSKILKVVNN